MKLVREARVWRREVWRREPLPLHVDRDEESWWVYRAALGSLIGLVMLSGYAAIWACVFGGVAYLVGLP